MRITKQMIYSKLSILNNCSRYQYDLNKDINGYRLVKIEKSSGETSISQRLTTREMSYVLDSIINYIYEEDSCYRY